MGWMIALAFSILMTIGGITGCATEPQKIEMYMVLGIFIILDIIFAVKYLNSKNGVSKKKKEEKQKKKAELKQKIQENKKLEERRITGKHQAGLPIAQDAVCRITNMDDEFQISGGGNNFVLQKDKISEISVMTDTEIQKQYVSSIGGAVAGGVVFGPLGAIVGGRAKEKKTKTKTYYLIFTYVSDNEVRYMSFEIEYAVTLKASKWRSDARGRTSSQDKIEL